MSTKGFLDLDIKDLKLPSWLSFNAPASSSSALKINYPPVALDIDSRHLILARLEKDKDKKTWSLASHEIVDLPENLIDAEVFHLDIKSLDQYEDLVIKTIQKEDERIDKVSLVLPDHLARVALIEFEELPRSRAEIVSMVRWKMKKAVPFKVEEAVVDYQVLPVSKGHLLLAVLMPSKIVDDQEGVFSRHTIQPGLIDLSTFSVANLYGRIIDEEVPEGGDFMLLNATDRFLTAMIFRNGKPIFYRCKTFGFDRALDESASRRLFHREIQASILYYQERLDGKELSRVYMRLVGHDAEAVASLFGDAPVASKPQLIDVRRVMTVNGNIDSYAPGGAEQTLQRLAPVVGAALGRDGSR